jgi:hypothetical protein
MTVLDANLSVRSLNTRRESLVQRLTTFRAHVRKHLLISGFAKLLAEVIAVCIFSLLLDRWLRLSLPMRVIFLLGMVIGFFYELWRLILSPLQIRAGLVDLAAALDRVRGASNGDSLAPRVATVLELPELLNREAPPSAAMVERAVRAADDSLRSFNFVEQLDDWRLKINSFLIGSILLISLLLAALNPQTTALWMKRWFAFSNEPWPQDTYLQVFGLKDGKIIVPRGEPYTIRISSRGKSLVPESISLRMREGKGTRATAAMNKFASNDFRFDLSAVQVPVTVEAEGGEDDIGPFTIEPVDRPKITSLELVSQHPTEKQPTKHDFGGQDADLSFLPKTHLELTFTSNVPIEESKVASAPGDVRRIGENKFAISWEHNKPVAMSIEMLSSGAHLMSLPTPVTVGLKADQPPRVSLSFTGVRQRITPMAKIPLTILARDDYGVAQIDLQSKADYIDPDKKAQSFSKGKTLFGPATQPSTEQEVQQKLQFDVTELKLVPGAILALTGAATDQRYEGPQTGLSRAATFRIVNPQELFREILLRQQGERAKFRKQIDECNKIKESLGTLTSTETAAAVARQHRNVQREVQRIGTVMSESMLEMRLNGLGTEDAFNLMDKNVLTPLKTMDTDLMTPQRDALDALGKDSKVEDALAREDQIIATMQQILKQMSQWDSFIDVLNQLNEIIRMQEAVKVGTEGLKTKQADDVFDK